MILFRTLLLQLIAVYELHSRCSNTRHGSALVSSFVTPSTTGIFQSSARFAAQKERNVNNKSFRLHESSSSDRSKEDEYDNNNDNGKEEELVVFTTASLQKRIQEVQSKEAQARDTLALGLSNRVMELQESTRILNEIQSQPTVKLPVISFDALLPKQTLQGRTEDPTFCRFLRDLGLGGWFVMTSLSPKTRKIRRHGVIAKIEAVDSIAGTTPGISSSSASASATSNSIDNIPTAIDFCIVGHARCRIVGQRTNMQQRIGRWRRGHDPNGEESVLGWGPERFVDSPDELEIMVLDEDSKNYDENDTRECTEWSSLFVECNLEKQDSESDEQIVHDNNLLQKKYQSLIPMVEEWYELASNVNTYKNLNVTAATRIRRGEPGLWVDPKVLLKQVRNGLGPRPEEPTKFCFWAAALINPLPVLGASLEIRGQLLEAPNLEQRLNVLEWGLMRSIDNLKGKRPL